MDDERGLTHEEGVHGYRRYLYQAGYTLSLRFFQADMATQQANVPDIYVFQPDNRSRYDGMSVTYKAMFRTA